MMKAGTALAFRAGSRLVVGHRTIIRQHNSALQSVRRPVALYDRYDGSSSVEAVSCSYESQRRWNGGSATTSGATISDSGAPAVASAANVVWERVPDWASHGRVASMVRRWKSDSSREHLFDVKVLRVEEEDGSRAIPLGGWKCEINVSLSIVPGPLPGATLPSAPSSSRAAVRPASTPRRAVQFCGIGYGVDERHATAAAAMHSERIASAMGLHLYGLPRMQENYALQSRKAGRWAPLPHESLDDAPSTTSASSLKPVVLVAATPTSPLSASPSSPHHGGGSAPMLRPGGVVHAPHLHAAGVAPSTVEARHSLAIRKRNAAKIKDFSMRCEDILFVHPDASEAPQPPIPVDDVDLDDGGVVADDERCMSDAEEATVWQRSVIDPCEVSIVDEGGVDDDDTSSPPPPPSSSLEGTHLPVNAVHPRCAGGAARDAVNRNVRRGMEDESEGGAFAMVEEDDLWDHNGAPGLSCLLDRHALTRLEDAVASIASAVGAADVVAELVIRRWMNVSENVKIDDAPSTSTSTTTTSDGGRHPSHWFVATMVLPVELFAYSYCLRQWQHYAATAGGSTTSTATSLHSADAVIAELVDVIRVILRGGEHTNPSPSPLSGWVAKGKADSVDMARVLCAMHAERRLEQLGVVLFPFDDSREALCVDACMRYGRRRGPTLITRHEALHITPNASPVLHVHSLMERRAKSLHAAGSLQRMALPLKLWRKAKTGSRRRFSSLGPEEALLALNRIIVSAVRIHTLEVDLASEHPEWLDEAIVICRHFFTETIRFQTHRAANAEDVARRLVPLDAELPFVVFHLAERQFRCSLFLPLERTFGVRGGYAVGSTPQSARGYCALHALDVLCSLGVPVFRDAVQQDAFVAKRKARGQICPLEAPVDLTTGRCKVPAELAARGAMLSGGRYIAFPRMRSPPIYREAAGCTTEVPPAISLWQAMTIDANSFDVCRDVTSLGSPMSSTFTLPTTALQSEGAAFKGTALTLDSMVNEYRKAGEVVSLKALFHGCLELLGMRASQRTKSTMVLAAQQRLSQHIRIPANNMWLMLPLDASVYGRRVAMGRGPHRKGAERAMIIHALRTMLILDVPELRELVTQRRQDLAPHLYVFWLLHMNGYSTSTNREEVAGMEQSVPLWLRDAVLNHCRRRRTPGGSSPRQGVSTPPIEATPTTCRNLRRVPSPNPVMTHELATKTFIPN